MSTTITRKTFAAVFAALFATLLALAMTPTAHAADVAAQADDDVKLVIFEKDMTANGDYTAAKEVKTYTEAQLTALAGKNTGVVSYLMGNSGGTVYSASSYIYLTDLLADAGLTLSSSEKVMFAAEHSYADWKAGTYTADESIYIKDGKYEGVTGADVAADTKFFQSYAKDGEGNAVFDADKPLDAKAILALQYRSASVESGKTASDAAASDKAKAGSGYCFLIGQTAASYEAKKLLNGYERPSGVWGLVVYRNPIDSASVTGISDQTYTGKAFTPAPTVTLFGKALKVGTDYTVDYKNNVNVGTATVTITGTGDYSGTITKTFAIAKASQKITAKKNVTKKLNANKKTKKLAKKATINVKKLAEVSAKTTVKYKATIAKADKKFISFNPKTAKITVKKGLKKGKHKVKVKLTAAADANYTAAKAKNITVTIKVK